MNPTIEKTWDGNERIREGRNGRIYTSTRGRWEWVVWIDGEFDSSHVRRSEAVDRLAELRTPPKYRICGAPRPAGYAITCGRSECQEAAYTPAGKMRGAR